MKNAQLFVGAIVEMRVSGGLTPVKIIRETSAGVRRYSRHNMAPSHATKRCVRWIGVNMKTGRELKPFSCNRARRILGWTNAARPEAQARGHRVPCSANCTKGAICSGAHWADCPHCRGTGFEPAEGSV